MRIEAQQKAEKQIELLLHQGELKIIRKKVIRVEDTSKCEEYLNELAERLSVNLYLPGKKYGDV